MDQEQAPPDWPLYSSIDPSTEPRSAPPCTCATSATLARMTTRSCSVEHQPRRWLATRR